MSSRALRKLQKQRDEELQQQVLDEEDSEPESASPAARSSAFALLGDEDADDDNDDEEEEEDDEHGDNEVVEAVKPGEIGYVTFLLHKTDIHARHCLTSAKLRQNRHPKSTADK